MAPYEAERFHEEPMGPEVTIYTTSTCPYCMRAKKLLTRKNVAFEEISIEGDPEARKTMMARAGGRTSVPQIFINGTHVGGCDELHELDYDGKLNPMLAQAS
jgi:glutaredoxin 3